MTTQKPKLLFIVLSALSFQLPAFSSQLGAQEADSRPEGRGLASDSQSHGRLEQLEGQILANPKDNLSLPKLEELSSLYLEIHQYNQMVDFLRKLEKTAVLGCELPVGYYIGLCRFNQLRYLEEAKNWQEYFDQRNLYREELFQETAKTVSGCPGSPLAIKSQAINWLEHKAQNDSLGKDALDKLINLINNYVRQDTIDLSSGLDVEVIKETADILQGEEEPALAKAVYNLYVSRLDNSKTAKEKLRLAAESALESGNISLAEIIYERYIEIIRGSLAKDALSGELIAIIKRFATDGWNKGNDPLYAEKVFGVLQDTCGKDYFTEDLRYLRAYNLQRLKDYTRCVEEYEILINSFPGGDYRDEAEFKLGIIHAYILGEEQGGVLYWKSLVERNTSTAFELLMAQFVSSFEYALESLYHLSLLSQYKGDLESAQAGYAKIFGLIAGNADFKNLSERIVARQKEIQESKPMEYNLKTFLDVSLKSGGLIGSQALALDLSAEPFKTTIGKPVNPALSHPGELPYSGKGGVKFSLNQPQTMTGCLVPELTYLWSGDLGSVYPVPTTPEFSTDYQTKGVKVVNVVVLSGLEPVGSALEMVDVDD